MSLVVAKAGVYLDDANGCYRVENANLGLASTTFLDLSTGRATLPLTFSNAGTLEGLMMLIRSGSNVCDKSLIFSLQQTKGTVTLTIASPGVVNLTGHGFVGGEVIVLQTTGALPTGLAAGSRYFVKYKDANSFNLSTTSGGANINFTGTQSGTHTLWYAVESKTLTSTQVCPATDKFAQINLPVTGWSSSIDTTASKWRFHVISSGGTTGTWYSMGTTATEPMHAAWSNTSVTWTTGDQFILDAYDTTKIKNTMTFNGAFFGQADNAISGFICRASNPSLVNPSLRISQANLSGPITLTFGGHIFVGAFSQWLVGSSTDRIPVAKKVKMVFADPTVGTISPAFITHSSSDGGREQIWYYGAQPTNVMATLAADAATGQAVITTVEDVSSWGWQVGDELSIGKQDVIGNGETATKIIQSITGGGKTITLTANLLTANRKAGGRVINLSRPVGVEVTSSRTSGTSSSLYNPSALIYDGCKVDSVLYTTSATLAYNYAEDANNLRGIQITDCILTSKSAALISIISSSVISPVGNSATRCYCHRVVPFVSVAAFYNTYWKSGVMSLDTIISNSPYASGNLAPVSGSSLAYLNVQNIENYNTVTTASSLAAAVNFWGQNGTFKNIYVWGHGGSGSGAVSVGTFVNPVEISNIQAEKCLYGLFIQASVSVNATIDSFKFGQESANTTDIFMLAGAVMDILLRSPLGVSVIDTTNLTACVGAIRITSFNGLANDDRVYLTEGIMQKTGTGLSDTTELVAGEKAIKLSRFAASLNSFYYDIKTTVKANEFINLLGYFKMPTGYGSVDRPKVSLISQDGAIDEVSLMSDIENNIEKFNLSGQVGSSNTVVTIRLEVPALNKSAYFGGMFLTRGSNVSNQANTYRVGTIWTNGLPTADDIMGGTVEPTVLVDAIDNDSIKFKTILGEVI